MDRNRRKAWAQASRPARSGEGSGRRLVPLLVLASVTVMTLDASTGKDSPLDPVRVAVGEVVGPVEEASTAAVRPFAGLVEALRSNRALREENAGLRAANDQLEARLVTAGPDHQRLAQLDALLQTAGDTGYSLVAARVVARGQAQAFSRTVTIDAGTSSGIKVDMTVLDNRGLVGRVTDVTSSTATVLLIVDSDSVVGGRLGSNLEIGTVRGRGDDGNQGTLDLDLVDNSVTPAKGDVVVTWGSKNGVPYVAGIPIGRVQSVFSSPRESKKHAVLAPFVDFTSLDVVGVVVPTGTQGDRPVLTAGDGR